MCGYASLAAYWSKVLEVLPKELSMKTRSTPFHPSLDSLRQKHTYMITNSEEKERKGKRKKMTHLLIKKQKRHDP